MRSYPFSAVVGSDDMALALILNAVSPPIGGVLVRGEKGTAKSTMVRALAALLPDVAVIADCRFSCDPADPDLSCPDGPHDPGRLEMHVHPDDPGGPIEYRPARLVELPVGATEDRVIGSLDLQKALGSGVTAYEPGLLAQAHRGVLYVDEVNLLHDHLVDLLLDAAAMGRNTVEREGVSVAHAARFVLVGTMNPEEGELRPQLLDRFGLTVQVAAPRDHEERAEVVRRRIAFDTDPDGFVAAYAESEKALSRRIVAARAQLPRVTLGDAMLRKIAEVCAGFEVDGMRADIVTARAAIAHAAWNERDAVTKDDVRAAARLALPHRRRRNPFDAPGLDEELLDRLLDDEPDPDPDSDEQQAEGEDPDLPPGQDQGQQPDQGPATSTPQSPGPSGRSDTDTNPPEPQQEDRSGEPDPADAGQPGPESSATPLLIARATTPYRVRMLRADGVGEGEAGRRSRAVTSIGRVVGAHADHRGGRLHLPATVRAAAPHQVARGRNAAARRDGDGRRDRDTQRNGDGPRDGDGARIADRQRNGDGRRDRDGERNGDALRIVAGDVRTAVTEGRESNLILFCVDASGSMAARKRMTAVKTAILSLLLDAYQRRDKVGLVTFRGSEAALALPPTSSVETAARRLDELPHGGRTPLAEGLLTAVDALRVERIRDPKRRPLLVVVTDGRATHGPDAVSRSRQVARYIGDLGIDAVVVDCEDGRFTLGLAADLATQMGAEHLALGQLSAEDLVGLAQHRQPGGHRSRKVA